MSERQAFHGEVVRVERDGFGVLPLLYFLKVDRHAPPPKVEVHLE